MSEKDEILQNEEMMEETAEETVKSSEKKNNDTIIAGKINITPPIVGVPCLLSCSFT